MNIANQELCSVTTNLAPATTFENLCLIWLCNKYSAFHFLSLTTVLFPRRPYVHKWSTRIFNMYWVFCNICKVGPYYAFWTQAVQIFNIRKWCPLLKLDVTYISLSAMSRKIVFFFQESWSFFREAIYPHNYKIAYVAFFIDLTAKLNHLNSELNGETKPS